MTLKQFFDKWNGKKCDFDGVYGGQCFDLFRMYLKEVLNKPQPYPTPAYPDRGRGAADLWTGFDSTPELNKYYEKIVNTSDFIPREGDIMIWNRKAGGGHGHVAIVYGSDQTLNYFYSFDQNWSQLSVCELVKHTYTNVYGVLRPKNNEPMQETILKKYNVKDEQELDQKIEEHVGTTWGGEENGGFLGSARKKIRELEAKIDSLSVSLSDSRDKHALFVSRIIDKLNPFLGLPNASDEEKAMEAIEKMISENSSLVSELKSSQKKWSERETALLDENRQLHSELDRLKEEIELMEKKHSDDILELKKRLENAQQSIDAHNEDKADFELFKGLWNKVKELLRIK